MAVEKRDIVIVGAGPAGSTAARQAALAGFHPLLIEKDRAPGASTACGGIAAYAFCHKLGLSADIVERRIRRTILRVDGTAVKFQANHPCFISFRRGCFDSFLAQRAVQSGAELLTAIQARSVDTDSQRLMLHELDSGREREVLGEIIIFADGPTTLAVKSYGIGHQPSRHTRVGLLFELEGTYGDGETMEMVVNTSAATTGYFWIFPKRDRVQVGVGAPRHSSAQLRTRLLDFIEGRPDLRRHRVLHRAAGLIPGQCAHRLVANGAMVVGDAAGLVNPVTGGGIALALLSGKIAGQVAASALKRRRTDHLALAGYPRRLHRMPGYLWLKTMAHWRHSLDSRKSAQKPLAYASMLRRYLGLLYLMRLPIEILLR